VDSSEGRHTLLPLKESIPEDEPFVSEVGIGLLALSAISDCCDVVVFFFLLGFEKKVRTGWQGLVARGDDSSGMH